MGANQSAALQNAVDDVEKDVAAKDTAVGGIRLFKFVTAGTEGKWEPLSANAQYNFYDAKQDSGSKHQDWFLEIEAGDIDARVDQDLSYDIALRERRVTFCAQGSVFAMRFPTPEGCGKFCDQLRDAAFYNTYQVEYADEEKRDKMRGGDEGAFLFPDSDEVFLDPMDEDEEDKPAPEELVTPGKVNVRQAASYKTPGRGGASAVKPSVGRVREEEEEDDDDDAPEIQGIIMGAGSNNFLMRGHIFDVLRNEVGGVTDPGINFTLRTPTLGGGAIGAASSSRPTRGGRTPAVAAAAMPGGGVVVTPSRVLLMQGETRMNVLTPADNTMVMHADPEAGKVVSTWKFQKDATDIPIRDIAAESKSSQLDHTAIFLGLDANRLCKWDMRDPRGVVQASPIVSYTGGKDYARGTNFTCMATSGEGYVAVGASDGRVRLYSSKTLTKANTSIPGLGAPITAIDVTYDGKWVLATTEKYLMVVKTTFTTDKGDTACGFTSRMGGRGSVPRLLRLKPEDAARLRNAPFSKAKFTWVTETGVHERWIVAGCGSASVIWNFAKVRSTTADSVSFGGLPACTDYLISSKTEKVVEAAFMHHRYVPQDADHHASLVVATPHDLFNVDA